MTCDIDEWDCYGLPGHDARSAEEIAEASAEMDEALGLELITIRLPIELVAELTEIARVKGVPLVVVIRAALSQHISNP